MKKISLILFSLVLLSCGTSKTVKQSKKNIKGKWVLDSIISTTSNIYKVNLLKDTTKECFTGSNWQFIPNNNSGTYSIIYKSCPTAIRNFIFTIEDIDASTGYQSFLLKPTNDKKKSKNNEGFRFQLVQISASSMQWKQTVLVDGKPFEIIMNFSKSLK